MFKYDKYIINSLIITKYINIKIFTFDSQKGDNLTQIEHTRYTISPKEFKSWVTHISFALLLCTTELSPVKYFFDLFINSAFEQIFNVMQLILVKLSGILSKNI